jgi:hypothetical protein
MIHIVLASFVRQTSVRFRFPLVRHQDHDRQSWTIYNTTGITYIASNATFEKPKKEIFPQTVIVPGDSTAPDDLQILTDELSRFAAELFDIEISGLSLAWGIKSGALPSLISCDGHFRCNRDAEPYEFYLTDIAFFIALETGQVPEPGKCFSRRPACVGAEIACPRQKIETWRIKKLSNSLHVEDKAGFVHYVKRRLGLICPALLVTSVQVCRNCFFIYAKEKMPARNAEKGSPSARSAQSTGPTRAALARQTLNMDTRPASAIASMRTSPSGLTYVQDISGKSVRKAKKTYVSQPFPAFLQHPL